MKIILVTQEGAGDGNIAEQDTLVQAETIENALRELGHTCSRLEASLDLRTLYRGLQDQSGAIIFNLVESLGGRDCLMHLAPEIYEAIGLRYTGARASTIKRTNDKCSAKRELLAAGLPTAPWFELQTDRLREYGTFLPGRYILKAATEHASVGMHDDAVVEVSSIDELRSYLKQFSARIDLPSMAELYIDGREFNLSLLDRPTGDRYVDGHDCDIFPPAEIDFSQLPVGKPRIVGFNAKWVEDSIEYQATPRTFDFPASDRDLLNRLQGLAKDTWRLFQGTGYARVDFRVDKNNHPFILEFNANPCITSYGGFMAAAEQAGLSYNAAIARIIESAC
jgi:D-alanine-D-alanine ligase